MKVLVIHCRYQYRGGEDAVVEEETRLLAANGVEVHQLHFDNSSHPMRKLVLSPFNPSAYRRTREKIRQCRPDVVHLHNLHFGASPSVIHAVKNAGLPFVMTLHNYRLLCPSATLFHNGKLFLDSIGKGFPWKAVSEGVYKNSRLLTFWTAAGHWLHRVAGTWKQCGRFIALNPQAKDLLLRSRLGLRSDQVTVKPNFLSQGAGPSGETSSSFLYVGRLSEEKGVRLLLETFSSSSHMLKIAGDGPLKQEVLDGCAAHANIEYLGILDKQEVQRQMQNGTALVFPSLWFEGMPMTIVEAFACGTPVIASRLGAMEYMVTPEYNGLLFRAGDRQHLQQTLDAWAELSPTERNRYRNNAWQTFLQHYTAEDNASQLLNIYRSVMSNASAKKNAAAATAIMEMR